MKNLFSVIGAGNVSAKHISRTAQGGKIDVGGVSTNRTDVKLKALGPIKNALTDAQHEIERNNQNDIRDQISTDLEALRPKGLLDTKITVGKNDTLGAIAFGLNRTATALWKANNPGLKVTPSAKEVNFNWGTEVRYLDTTGAVSRTVKLSQANELQAGDVVTLEKDAAGKTVILVNTTAKPDPTSKPKPTPTSKPSPTSKPKPAPTSKPKPTQKPWIPAPTSKPKSTPKPGPWAPTPAPTSKPKPTQKPWIPAPTSKPKSTPKPGPWAPTPAPTSKPKPTQKPWIPAPTNKPGPWAPTPAPTSKPKPAPTSKPKSTPKPWIPAPTNKPGPWAPTSKPKPAPTSKPGPWAPTPTVKPTSWIPAPAATKKPTPTAQPKLKPTPKPKII